MKVHFEIEKLIAARALIEDPAHWCQGANALDAAGNVCPTRSPEAVCWCAHGACFAVDANDAALRQVPGVYGHLQGYNDSHTHADVLDLFTFAINSLLNAPNVGKLSNN